MSGDQFLEESWARLSKVFVKGAQYNSPERLPHPKCLEGTRVNLLTYIDGFLDGTEKNQLIWLHGTAGVGKSAVAFTVAERMRGLKMTEQTHVETRLGGTFFFSRKHTNRCTTGRFFATLIYQLATNFPSVRKDVKRVICDNPALLDPDTPLRDQMEALFLQPLRWLQLRLRGGPPLSFVIDALDECTSEPELTDLILSLARALREPDLPVTHILLTSRSESHISKVMQNEEVHPLVREIPVRTSGEGGIISLDGTDVDKDISTFLRHSFGELKSRHPDFPQPSEDDLGELASRAGRRFIVASTMMKFIIDDEDKDPYDRLQLMLKLTSELLAGTEVYKLYDCILSTCVDPKRAYMHLSIVAALADPLPISQISSLLGPGLGRDVQTTLIQLRSVIDIPTDTGLPVNIYHSSIRDYVSNPSNCSLPQVRDITSPHSLLADSSLRLMMKEIPERTALLDALSELKKHSQAMQPEDPNILKDSLAFLVQSPEPVSIFMGMLWLRGDRKSDEQSWLKTAEGGTWLQTQAARDWLQTEGARDWLQTQAARDWVQTQSGLDWVQTQAGQDWLQTQAGRHWLQTQSGRHWLQTQSGRHWLQTRAGQLWLQTQAGRDWLQTRAGRHWLQTVEARERAQTKEAREWAQTGEARACVHNQAERDWLRTRGGRDWLQTQGARDWLQTEAGRDWLQTQEAQEWLQTQAAEDWVQTQASRDWLQTEASREWLQTEAARGWVQTQAGQDWLQTQAPQDWLQTKAGQHWLQTLASRHWLQTQAGRAWVQTRAGRAWVQTHAGRNWLQTEGLQTEAGRDWLQTEAGIDWLQTQGARDWLQTQGARDWLQTEGAQDWLQTQAARDWLHTWRGRDWLQTQGARDWLQTQTGRDWLQTQAGRDWLQTQAGRDWLQTQGGHIWLKTLNGRDWLQTSHGKVWQTTPAASVWVTMEEFSSTLQAMNEYTIIPELLSLPAFQAVQQFKSLPDFLMFPMFLALMDQDHPTFTLPEAFLSSDREIIQAINAFTTLADGARGQSRSTSDALKYACQNWAVHLLQAPEHELDHTFQTFWNRHLLSWLERQWCLKGLRSCLVVLSQGQKLAKVDIVNSQHSQDSQILRILSMTATMVARWFSATGSLSF